MLSVENLVSRYGRIEVLHGVALAIADRGYIMETGRIEISGRGRALLDDDRVRAAYLGL